MIEYGNRGKAFEKQVNAFIALCDNRGLHAQQNHPEKLHSGEYISKHPFDYQVLYDGVFYAFDAKNSESKTLHISNLKPHQLNGLKKVKENGGSAFFMIYFAIEKKIIQLDIDEAIQILSSGRKSISTDDGKSIRLNFLNIK